MSSFLFYSSPPPAPYQQQNSFLTPQTNRFNTFATNHSHWPSYQPKSPSPLRTSANTSNLMRRHEQHYTFGGKLHQSSYDDENSQLPSVNTTSQTSALAASQGFNKDSHFYTSPLANITTTELTEEAESTIQRLPTQSTNAAATQRNQFVFQQRARDTSATSQISSRIANGRESRKTGFIDRLRRSRRDERDSRGIDSFEKAEYWRERREWEARLRREATRYGEFAFEAQEHGDELNYSEYPDVGVSPIDEEQELAELVEAYYDVPRPVAGDNDSLLMDEGSGLDDEDAYDAAFMEVLNQANITPSSEIPGCGIESIEIHGTGAGGTNLVTQPGGTHDGTGDDAMEMF